MSASGDTDRRGLRRLVRGLVVVVLAADVLAAAALLTGWTSNPSVAQEVDARAEEPAPTAETLRRLGYELARRSEELERRETELAELMRGSEVLRRAGLLPEPEEDPADDASAAPDGAGADEEADGPSVAFVSLQRAYENMEPDSAALALAQLADRDKNAVVELLLGWKPRTSGAILDALTQADPALAADLSYEIWRLERGEEPGAGEPVR